jgi:PAS domain-containing protein
MTAPTFAPRASSRLPPALAIAFCAAVLVVMVALLWPQARQGGWLWLLLSMSVAGLMLLLLGLRSLQAQREQIRSTERELTRANALLDAASDAIIIYDPADWRIREVNRAALEQLGYTRAE